MQAATTMTKMSHGMKIRGEKAETTETGSFSLYIGKQIQRDELRGKLQERENSGIVYGDSYSVRDAMRKHDDF